MIQPTVHPHPSCKYAVISNPIMGGYLVVAVHAIDADHILASVQFSVGDSHVYRPPVMIPIESIEALAQTTEAAWKHRRHLEDQDREGVQR